MKNFCVSSRHNEYSCLIRWSVTSRKFDVSKWCDGCVKNYENIPLVRNWQPQAAPPKAARRNRVKK